MQQIKLIHEAPKEGSPGSSLRGHAAMDLDQGLEAFGLSADTVVSALGPRCWQLVLGGSTYVLKVGSNGAMSEGLRNEAHWLRTCTSRVVDFAERPAGTALLLRFVHGAPLTVNDPVSADTLLSEVAALHRQGLIFCDLTPANVLVEGNKISLIDWEFCCAIGDDLSAMTRRPYSSGFTHPDLIWAKGNARTDLDLFALHRFFQMGFTVLSSENKLKSLIGNN
jgi:serine/threonine protein kinase